MAPTLCACSSSVDELETELIDLGKMLLHLPYSNADLLNLLQQTEKILSTVEQTPPESIIQAMQPIIETLISNEMMKHADMNVNISVATCICEVMRIMAPENPCNDEQMKDFFEMVVITFERLSSAFGGCYTRMTRVLKIFSSIRLSVLMLDLETDAHGLIVRLFTQFLTVADSSSSAILLKMEKIMSMIIEESGELAPELLRFLVSRVKNSNQIASPVCWQLVEKVLVNCATEHKPHFPNMGRDMTIALYDYSKMVGQVCKIESENNVNLRKDTTHMIKVECLETLRRCRQEKNTLSSNGPPMGMKSETEVNGKRKRNDTPSKEQSGDEENLDVKRESCDLVEDVSAISDSMENLSSPQSGISCVHGYNMKKSVAPILESIFKKHGDIAADCVFKNTLVRTSFLEVVCEVTRQIETNNFTNMEEIESVVLEAETANINVSWLQARLEDMKKPKLLMEMKANIILAERSAQMDLKERLAELVAAQERLEKAERCEKVLGLVKKKLNANISQSKA